MELDFGGGGGVGLLGRPIIRWTRSPLAYDRVSVLRLLFPSLTFPFSGVDVFKKSSPV